MRGNLCCSLRPPWTQNRCSFDLQRKLAKCPIAGQDLPHGPDKLLRTLFYPLRVYKMNPFHRSLPALENWIWVSCPFPLPFLILDQFTLSQMSVPCRFERGDVEECFWPWDVTMIRFLFWWVGRGSWSLTKDCGKWGMSGHSFPGRFRTGKVTPVLDSSKSRPSSGGKIPHLPQLRSKCCPSPESQNHHRYLPPQSVSVFLPEKAGGLPSEMQA